MLFKWSLLFRSLPFAILVLLLKLIATEVFSFEGLLELSEIAIFMTSGIFLLGFMLAGTLSDYKESERVPGEIACILEALEETAVMLSVKAGYSVQHARQEVFILGNNIVECFHKRIKTSELHERLYKFNQLIIDLDHAGAAATIVGSRLMGELSNLRRLLTRANVISRTGFLATGYALLELVLLILAILFICAKFKNLLAQVVITAFITLLYTYMYQLIRDIDDPFEYHHRTPSNGATEVSLFPLQEYLERAEKRLDLEERPTPQV
ncbi:MAG TPA: hypothetical protein DCM08_06760 [Microscillaceae bacterium]|jgi:hypothetical protein|nr:hypothetical protein [Microscillaceae bacterium]